MGRFEQRIRKIAKDETDSFERWAELHEEELRSAGVQMTKKKVKQKRKYQWLYSGVAVAGVIIVCLVFSLSVFLPRESGDVYYSERDVFTDKVTAEEIDELENTLPIVRDFSEVVTRGVRLVETNQLVFLTVSGELLSETDYYLITVNQHIDLRYNFVEKDFYDDFTDHFVYEDIISDYKYDGMSQEGFNQYYMLLQKADKFFYLEISCLGDNLDEFFVLLSE